MQNKNIIFILLGIIAFFGVLFNATATLVCITILGVLFSLWKVVHPKVNIRIVSFYPTFLEDRKYGCVLKVRIESSSDLILEDLNVFVKQADIFKHQILEHFRLRRKGFIPVMRDNKGKEVKYKLLKPLEPQLFDQIISSGINQYYIALRSRSEFQDRTIEKWKFKLTTRSPLSFIPNFLSSTKLTLRVEHPEIKDLYFDDDLLQKINDEEAEALRAEL